eukprot:TRINITY_DN10872_c1_g4_i2.p1 TRINITY_DN10872_c1_g4~~TRINITY_DN10872_c1_g4_i2.p1  ORF type:complete len:416 (+),score=129.53 TRINITY_DN10872_c1_g4_i2:3-1250(+)
MAAFNPSLPEGYQHAYMLEKDLMENMQPDQDDFEQKLKDVLQSKDIFERSLVPSHYETTYKKAHDVQMQELSRRLLQVENNYAQQDRKIAECNDSIRVHDRQAADFEDRVADNEKKLQTLAEELKVLKTLSMDVQAVQDKISFLTVTYESLQEKLLKIDVNASEARRLFDVRCDDIDQLKLCHSFIKDKLSTTINHMEQIKTDVFKLSAEVAELKAASERLDLKVDDLKIKFQDLEDKFDALEGRFDALEGRFDALEGRFDALEGRFDALEGRFDALNSKVDIKFDMLNNKFDNELTLLQAEADAKAANDFRRMLNAQNHTKGRADRIQTLCKQRRGHPVGGVPRLLRGFVEEDVPVHVGTAAPRALLAALDDKEADLGEVCNAFNWFYGEILTNPDEEPNLRREDLLVFHGICE